jgi:hypothetical protein
MLNFIFFLYPLGEVIAAAILVLSIFRQSWRHLRKAATILFLLHTALFALAFVHICTDPYWYDNGAQEFIPLEERWVWALFELAFIELIAGPILFLGFLYLKRDPPPSSLRGPDRVE